MDTQVAAVLQAAGYPVPPSAEDAVRMLLGEIDAAKRLADGTYRGGYRTGYDHGYNAGRRAAACEHRTYPKGSPS